MATSTQTALELSRERLITPRQLDLEIPRDTQRYWFGNDPYGTHLMNAFSLLFPPGERFFMDAVRHFRTQLTDPVLLAQVRGFLGQEALHSREHKVLNAWLGTFGVDAQGIEDSVASDIEARRAKRTPIDDLAVTCALEHFTALMAEMWLNEPTLREQAVEPLRALWTWHALEELDHKSVAFDVYRAVNGDEATRLRWMRRITVGFVLGVSYLHLRMMYKDQQLTRPLTLVKSWWKYWGPRGYFTRQIPHYLRYYKRDFHPWEQDSRALIARFERELATTNAS
ncbi:MAG: metal-dependent hydrolase [Myxococcaceae bacterium]|nr:metal-dependent hydrolase [Myxococcaceae bacterium]